MRGKVARKSWKEKEREVEEEKSERRTNPDPPCLFMKQKEARVRKQSWSCVTKNPYFSLLCYCDPEVQNSLSSRSVWFQTIRRLCESTIVVTSSTLPSRYQSEADFKRRYPKWAARYLSLCYMSPPELYPTVFTEIHEQGGLTAIIGTASRVTIGPCWVFILNKSLSVENVFQNMTFNDQSMVVPACIHCKYAN